MVWLHRLSASHFSLFLCSVRAFCVCLFTHMHMCALRLLASENIDMLWSRNERVRMRTRKREREKIESLNTSSAVMRQSAVTSKIIFLSLSRCASSTHSSAQSWEQEQFQRGCPSTHCSLDTGDSSTNAFICSRFVFAFVSRFFSLTPHMEPEPSVTVSTKHDSTVNTAINNPVLDSLASQNKTGARQAEDIITRTRRLLKRNCRWRLSEQCRDRFASSRGIELSQFFNWSNSP